MQKSNFFMAKSKLMDQSLIGICSVKVCMGSCWCCQKEDSLLSLPPQAPAHRGWEGEDIFTPV